MGFKDKFKDFFNPEVDEFEDETEGQSDLDYGEYDSFKNVDRSGRSGSDYYDRPSASSRSVSSQRTTSANGKVVNMGAGSQLQVVLVKPEKFEDATGIADHLCAKRTVVVNVENTSKDVVRRLVDFLSGVAYANKGTIKRAANSTFVVTPNNVDVMGDVLFEDSDSSNSYFNQ